MALVLADRVKETTSTTGTGTWNLSGAVTGFQTFVAAIGTGNTTYYSAYDGNSNWEVGLGTVTSGSPNTLSRNTIYASSNAGAAVNFTTAPTVWCDYPAGKATALTNPTPTAGGVLYGTGSAAAVTSAGTSGYFLQSTGSGAPTWSSVSTGAAYTKTDFTATAGQTSFSATYTVGYVDVYQNGAKLSTTQYTATNGTSIVLGTGAVVNDIVEIIAWIILGATPNPITVGTSTVTSGTSGRVLYDNAGVVGEYTITGTAGSSVLSIAPAITGIATTDLFATNNNAVSVSSNAGTCSQSYELNTFTNSSAATMTITLAVSTPTPKDGQKMIVRIYDFSAAAQTISWVNTENSTATVPTTSNGSTTLPLTVGFMYNAQTSKWRCVASA